MLNPVSIRLDSETIQSLDNLGSHVGRSRTWLIQDAVQRYLAEEMKFLAAVQEGIDQADKGEFASDEEVKAAFARLGVDYDLD